MPRFVDLLIILRVYNRTNSSLYCFIQDPVVIFKGHLKRLAEGFYWNDSLIDLMVRRFVMESLGEGKVNKVHTFSSLFYSKLVQESSHDSAHTSVARWTKRVDLFAVDFMLVPLNYKIHWSLLVVVRPGILARNLALMLANGRYRKESVPPIENPLGPDQSGNQCCIIHFDSLGMHNTAEFSSRIKE